jgi:hypothetical protein
VCVQRTAALFGSISGLIATPSLGSTAYVLVPRPVVNDKLGAPQPFRRTLEVPTSGQRVVRLSD